MVYKHWGKFLFSVGLVLEAMLLLYSFFVIATSTWVASTVSTEFEPVENTVNWDNPIRYGRSHMSFDVSVYEYTYVVKGKSYQGATVSNMLIYPNTIETVPSGQVRVWYCVLVPGISMLVKPSVDYVLVNLSPLVLLTFVLLVAIWIRGRKNLYKRRRSHR